jgi:hypothetical protein
VAAATPSSTEGLNTPKRSVALTTDTLPQPIASTRTQSLPRY